MTSNPEMAQSVKKLPLNLNFSLRDAGMVLGLILIVVVFASLTPVFLTAPNIINVLQQSSINAAIALGMTWSSFLVGLICPQA